MSDFEQFSQARMDRCVRIHRAIMDQWQKTNSFNYTVRATSKLDGLNFDSIRREYFAVGPNPNNLTEIPFHDMLVIFDMIAQHNKAFKDRPKASGGTFTIKFEIHTEFPDDKVAAMLSSIKIETPFDQGKVLRVRAVENPDAE